MSDLNKKENEQVIFDTINSTGVKLTASDIIKNALFQKIKLSGKSLENFYSETWQKCFEDSSDIQDLWLETKGLGQSQRSNIDLFFYSFVIIEGFFHVKREKVQLFIEKKTMQRISFPKYVRWTLLYED